MTRHFLTDKDVSAAEQAALLDLALAMKANPREYRRALDGAVLGMIFTKHSTRTRASFEAGIAQLGGSGLVLDPQSSQIGRGEPIGDTGRVLSRYCDLLMIRTFKHQDVRALAEASRVPVINGLDDDWHPCQTLADMLTIREAFGKLAGLHLVYVGDGNNVANSLAVGCTLAGMRVTVISPQGWQVKAPVLALARGAAVTDDLDAVRDADVIYTDVWASMGQESEAAQRRQAFAGYQVSSAMMAKAHKDAIFLHCLPAHRGEEVAADVIDGPKSRVFDQAENRLHAQKALMHFLSGAGSVRREP
jgi:ornithine carbamoyltransferase